MNASKLNLFAVGWNQRFFGKKINLICRRASAEKIICKQLKLCYNLINFLILHYSPIWSTFRRPRSYRRLFKLSTLGVSGIYNCLYFTNKGLHWCQIMVPWNCIVIGVVWLFTCRVSFCEKGKINSNLIFICN